PDFIYLEDTTGDDVADTRDFILHGFGTEDAHHSLSAIPGGPMEHCISTWPHFYIPRCKPPMRPVEERTERPGGMIPKGGNWTTLFHTLTPSHGGTYSMRTAII